MLSIYDAKILVTGGNGFVGRHVVEKLKREGVPEDHIYIPRSADYDLREQGNCRKVVADMDIVIHLAANIGGIAYNDTNPGTIFYDNILMGTHMMEESRKAGVQKFVTVSTACVYPDLAHIPCMEHELWDGYPAHTTAPYALAKKMLLVQGQAYKKQYDFDSIYLILTNTYGPGDHFETEASHVIPALIKKCIDAKAADAKEIVIWGTGNATRDFLYVDDAAKAIVLAAKSYDSQEPVNIGSSQETSIKELAETIADIIGYTGTIVFDATRPEGQLRRKLDTTRAYKEFMFRATSDMRENLQKTIQWYEESSLPRTVREKITMTSSSA